MKGFGNRQSNRKKKTSSNLQKEINKISNISNEQLVLKALKYHSDGDLLNAERQYKLCLRQGSNDPRVLSNYGLICKEAGRFDEAIKLWTKSTRLYPVNPRPYFNLANLLIDIRRFKEAEKFIKEGISLNPNEAKMHYNLGIILRNNRKYKEAILSFKKAIQLKPEFTEAHSNLAEAFLEIGDIKDAKKSIIKAIKIDPKDAKLYLNFSKILKENRELKDAEINIKKAIILNPNFAEAHSNLGANFSHLGKLKEAESSICKAIELNPNYAKAYYLLSLLKSSNYKKEFKNKLFSKSILNKQTEKDKIDIYFARSNILHIERDYKSSAVNLLLANNLKLDLAGSQPEGLINKSKKLLFESEKLEIYEKDNENSFSSIFIVGMPRSGSTLLESILSMNGNVNDLGETNILEESYEESKKLDERLTLAEIYRNKINDYKSKLSISTNKWLYNYQYTGIISKQIPKAKIIHCFRNPLDNILSIYRAHFEGNEYSSSLVDCARVYLDQEEVMAEYKTRFRSQIYDLNYDLLVSNPNQEIKSLISWLDWEWDECYLSPHLNPRSVSTASSVQVRTPINSKSIGGWKNYRDMLHPAIEILSKTDRYRELDC